MGVKFGDKHSETDWELIMVDFEIETPEPKLKFVSIPGRDGDIDLTESQGEVKYFNRAIGLAFVAKGGADNPNIATIINLLHGKTTQIIFDHDPGYYYSGRCTVSHSQEDQLHGILQVRAECSPFKFKTSLTTVSKVATTSGVVATCTVEHRRVRPTITTDAAVQVTFGGDTYVFSAGTTTMPFDLAPGANSLTLTTATGTANVDIKWREQSL